MKVYYSLILCSLVLFILVSFSPAPDETERLRQCTTSRNALFLRLSYSTINKTAVIDHPSKASKLAKYFVQQIKTFSLLLLSGDIETNPGPQLEYTNAKKLSERHANKIKFFHINVEDATYKHIQLQQLVNDMGENTVIGFCETWLTENNEKKLWEFSPKIFKTFRTDRNKTCSIKTKGGGVMILVPKHLNPKERPDLNQIDPAYFESLWVECNLPGNGKKRQLINISYCPQKSLKVSFIEQLACSIDKAITENRYHFKFPDLEKISVWISKEDLHDRCTKSFH